MNSRICRIVGAAIVASAMSVAAQTSPASATPAADMAPMQTPANVALIYSNQPKGGGIRQYEQGRKKHMAWHRSQKDPWTWYVWEIMTGDHTGGYTVGTLNHSWKDLDGREEFEAADSADSAVNLAPFETHSQLQYYIYRKDLSTAPNDQAPAPLSSITIFEVKPEGVGDFVASIKKINEGIQKTNYGTRSAWYTLANGGQGPQFVLVQERKNFAAMQAQDKSLDAMMKEAFGDEGTAVLKTLRNSYRSNYSQLLRYRPDLSYVPAPK